VPDRVARPHLDEGRHLDRLAARLDVRRTQILATRQLPHPVWAARGQRRPATTHLTAEPKDDHYDRPILLTPTEAARALGIGRSKLYELQAGVLESVHIGACRRIPTDALLALFVELRGGQADAAAG